MMCVMNVKQKIFLIFTTILICFLSFNLNFLCFEKFCCFRNSPPHPKRKEGERVTRLIYLTYANNGGMVGF